MIISPQTDLTPGNSKRDIIESMVLKLNGSERFSQKAEGTFLYTNNHYNTFNVASHTKWYLLL